MIFLTTLGVYLGLVLAGGASSQVFAHTALTRNFDIRDEIEFKDDLDNKPDGCDLTRDDITNLETKYLWFNSRSISEYTNLLGRVLDAYPETVDELDFTWDSVGDFRPSRRVIFTANFPVGETGHDLDREVLFVGNGMPGRSFSFSAFRNSLESRFRFESQAIPYDSAIVGELYAKAFEFNQCSQPPKLEELILKNTDVSVEGTNLVISTRLPRGSLDSLLATDTQ